MIMTIKVLFTAFAIVTPIFLLLAFLDENTFATFGRPKLTRFINVLAIVWGSLLFLTFCNAIAILIMWVWR